jgi:hypothetical protein
MSEPHIIGAPQQQPLAAADAIIDHYVDQELEDFMQTASDNGWDLDKSRSHILYQLCLLDWHLRPHLDVNPDRYFLSVLDEELFGTEAYERLDPSLKYPDTEYDDPPFVEDHHSDNRGCYNPYPD